MSRRFCISCGVKLNRKNRYKIHTHGRKYSSICKTCDNNKRKANRIRSGQKFVLKIRDRKIEFSSIQARNEFITMRRLQAKYGRCHISYSSNTHKTVWVPRYKEVKRKDIKIILKYYAPMTCEECGGSVVYMEHGFQVCAVCGLVVNDHLNVIYIEPATQKKSVPPWYKYTIPIPETNYQGDSSENVRCYDKYYAQAYSKRLK